ncbi:hypothetical protein N9Y42_01475 [Mariniblastus sp.]|nr:hypothetical protein [Mariniblastus sp.]
MRSKLYLFGQRHQIFISPGGEPYLHGNSDGGGDLDPTKDWKSYKIPIKFPETPELSDYKAGNPALVTHLDDVASLSLDDVTALVCEMELPELETQSKFKFINTLRANVDSLDSLATKLRNNGDEEQARIVDCVETLLNMNTVYDVQNTKTAEFWRTFK